jgi:hypothetical protein
VWQALYLFLRDVRRQPDQALASLLKYAEKDTTNASSSEREKQISALVQHELAQLFRTVGRTADARHAFENAHALDRSNPAYPPPSCWPTVTHAMHTRVYAQ